VLCVTARCGAGLTRHQTRSTKRLKVRLGADMVEKTNVDSVGFALLDRNDGFPRSRLHPQT
jgi:hypothetical protein